MQLIDDSKSGSPCHVKDMSICFVGMQKVSIKHMVIYMINKFEITAKINHLRTSGRYIMKWYVTSTLLYLLSAFQWI